MILFSRVFNLFLMIMMTLITIMAIPFFISKITNSPIYTHPAFVEYLSDFRKDADRYNVDVSYYKLVTVFSNGEQQGVAAFCLPSTKTVVIYSSTWKELTKEGRKALLYHEWGHCLLRRDHVEDINYVQLCPHSLMYPYIEPLKTCYGKYQESYNRELFTNPFNFKTFSRSRK